MNLAELASAARDQGLTRDSLKRYLIENETPEVAHLAYLQWAERTATDIAADAVKPAGRTPRAGKLERDTSTEAMFLPAEVAWAEKLTYVARQYQRARRVELIENVDRKYVQPYVRANGWPLIGLGDFLALAGVPAELIAAFAA